MTAGASFVAGRFGLHVEGARILTITNGIGKGFREEIFATSQGRFVAPFPKRVSRWRSVARNQAHARETALAELQQVLRASREQQIARFDDFPVDAHRALAELAHRLRRARRKTRSLE